MTFVQYTCDACDAQFKIDITDTTKDALMCPECAETELLTVAGLSDGASCQAVPGTKKRT